MKLWWPDGSRTSMAPNLYVAIRDVFDAIGRRLEEYARRRHGQVKTHVAVSPPPS